MADLIIAFFYLIGGILSGGKPDDNNSFINENSKRPYWNSKIK